MKYVLLSILVVLSSCVSHEDLGSHLLREKGPMIYKLTPPDNDRTGCTGFSLEVNGKNFIISNAHCADLARGGQVAASNGHLITPRLIELLAVSKKTDLSIWSAIPGEPTLHVAKTHDLFDRVHVIGRPFLNPNTYSTGYVIAREVSLIANEKMTLEQCNDGLNWPEQVDATRFECVSHVDSYHISALVYPGNSGSPVMNDDGDVIGVAFATNLRDYTGSMVPLDVLVGFLHDLSLTK